MNINEQLWAEHQFNVLVSFVDHIAYWRCAHNIYTSNQLRDEFWTRTIDAHLLRAVVDWCMIFGADSNEIHWKNVVPVETDQENFRAFLLGQVGLNGQEWCDYWGDMTTFRNDFAAHRVAASPYPCVPKMETALQVVFAYDQWLRVAIHEPFDFVINEFVLSERHRELLDAANLYLLNVMKPASGVGMRK